MRRILSITLMLVAVATLQAQQPEADESNTRSRDLSNMFYSDTLPATNVSVNNSAPGKAVPAQSKPLRHANSTGAKATSAASGLGRRVGVKLSLLMHDADCNVQEVPSTRVFQSGEQIRLQIESNVDGYLSVLERGSSGNEALLFPSPRINGGQNRVQRGVQYSVPSTGWFTFNDQPGEEHLLVVVSRKPLSWLPAPSATGAADPQTPPVQMGTTLSALQHTVHERDLAVMEEKAPQVGKQAPNTQSMIVLNTSSTQNDTVYVQLTLKHQ